jgi:N utilization substance protein B
LQPFLKKIVLKMLTRKILRARAMQAIYAYERTKEAIYHAAKDMIELSFTPDFAAAEAPNLPELKKNTEEAQQLFAKSYQQQQLNPNIDAPVAIRKAALLALNYYKDELQKEKRKITSHLLLDTERVFEYYVQLLLLLIELANMVEYEEQRKMSIYKDAQPALKHTLKFLNNAVVQALRNNERLKQEKIRRNITWEGKRGDFIKKLYREQLKNNPAYVDYVMAETTTPEQDYELIREIIKTVLFKNAIADNFYEEEFLNWEENEEIAKGLFMKTIKSFPKNNHESIEIFEISPDWEQDREFLQEIYRTTLEHSEEAEQILIPFLKNWEADRITNIDKILLKMAINEMQYFPSIPVKVTINEYIDLGKMYATPKSKEFINGVLDAVAKKLQQEGKIRKSGRGLMDNK